MMTPEQKLKWLIINDAAEWNDQPIPEVDETNVDELYRQIVEKDEHWDSKEEVRCSGTETGIPNRYSSIALESCEVAAQMPDDTWVGWTYWSGGKHTNPEEIPWMENAYDVTVVESQVMKTVRTFSVKQGGEK